MAFFNHLSQCGGELRREGGVLLKARLSEWERELQYLRFRIAEWKQFGSADHPDYKGFRSFLLQKVSDHLRFELKTFSTILTACEVAAESDGVPPLQGYTDSILAFRERISPGEITRRLHFHEWDVYMRIKDKEKDDKQSEMDDMFERMRNEITGMERRSKEFKLMVDELVRMVAGMQERLRQGAGGGGGGSDGGGRGGGLQIRPDEFVHVDGFWIRSARRVPPYASPAHRRGAGGTRAMTRSPSDLLPTPILANSRARLPPPTGIQPPPPPPSSLPIAAASTTNPTRRLPTTSISSVSGSRHRQQQTVTPLPLSSMMIARTITLPSSPSRSRSRSRSRSPPPPPPPRTARNIHRRLFQRVFHMSQNFNVPPQHRTRTPSPGPAARAPSPLGTPEPQPSRSGFSSYESPSAGLIAGTRTRLPPSPESPAIPYRPPGQRLFSFLHRL